MTCEIQGSQPCRTLQARATVTQGTTGSLQWTMLEGSGEEEQGLPLVTCFSGLSLGDYLRRERQQLTTRGFRLPISTQRADQSL